MSANIQQFDYDQAKTLQTTLEGQISQIDTAINSINSLIQDTVPKIWKGGSEQKFISLFDKNQKDVRNELKNWLKAYKDQVVTHAKIYAEEDKELGSAINSMMSKK